MKSTNLMCCFFQDNVVIEQSHVIETEKLHDHPQVS